MLCGILALWRGDRSPTLTQWAQNMINCGCGQVDERDSLALKKL